MNQKASNPYGINPHAVASEPQDQTSIPAYKNNTLAIVSLVLGILSLFFSFLTAIPGIITGHMARSKAKKNPDLYEGKGMALAGLILSYLMLVLAIAITLGFTYAFMEMPGFKDAFLEGMSEGFKQTYGGK